MRTCQPETGTQRVEERRRSPRRAAVRPCKVFHRPTGRYLVASTCDLSAGGAMLRVRAPRPLRPGDEIEVLIALHPRQLLEAADQRPARVVRAMTTPEGDQIAGVEYEAAGQARLAA